MTEPYETAGWIALAAFAVHVSIVISISLRVLMRRRPPGSAAAWLLLVIMLPYAGAVLYLLIGERPLGRKRTRLSYQMYETIQPWLQKLEAYRSELPATTEKRWKATRRLSDSMLGIPALPGNRLELIDDTDAILRSIINDINRAERFCLLEFYIWHPGGLADEVARTLIDAASRGVVCHVLLDGIGSAAFFKSQWPKLMRDANIHVVSALPTNLLRAVFRRIDLRMHRKIVIVDGDIAYTGSLNMVDPRFFKQDAGVGQWIDAMARIEGPAVKVLAGLFAWDWVMETGGDFSDLMKLIDADTDNRCGDAVVQMMPSGPVFQNNATVKLLLSAIYDAREELILTTPYFVPNDSLIIALCSAARRGVKVRLIVPGKVDSFLVRHASRSFYSELLESGVEILLFNGGLLHTKSIVVDRELALFGTLNLDIRSLQLNFEVTLAIYDAGFAGILVELTKRYAASSSRIDLEAWEQRPHHQRLIDNTLHLISPLL